MLSLPEKKNVQQLYAVVVFPSYRFLFSITFFMARLSKMTLVLFEFNHLIEVQCMFLIQQSTSSLQILENGQGCFYLMVSVADTSTHIQLCDTVFPCTKDGCFLQVL